ncbi:MAG: lipoate--protein ligase [Lachnospiraceae bacterium]|nr:lipoate--protein ligase [Lachnospiraceae bacterium]
MSKIQMYVNLNSEIYTNLAIEEYFMKNNDNDDIIFLWSNSPAVVIGRNQNEHKECNLLEMERDKVALARRKTGGGAVYQDNGNLNFTCIHNEKNNYIDIIALVMNYLKSKQIDVILSGRNDIVTKCGNRKISGIASMQTDNKTLIHGTLLINVNLTHMDKYLNVSPQKLKGIPSVQSRVININQINKDLTIEAVKDGLIDFIINSSHSDCCQQSLPDSNCYSHIRELYSDYNWNHVTPFAYKHEIYKKFSWGELSICFQIKKEQISALKIYTDALDCELINLIEKKCLNMTLEKTQIEHHFSELADFIGTQNKHSFYSCDLQTILSDIKTSLLYF